MAINYLSRIGLGLTGITGSGLTIGVPIVLNTKEVSAGDDKEGIVKAEIFKNLEACSDTNQLTGDSIAFGASTNEKVCGKFDSSAVSTVLSTERKKYNQLFQNIGNHPKDEGKMYSDYGRADCPDGNKGIIPNQTKEKEFIGLCNGSYSYRQGITIERKDSGNPIVKVCSGNCFEKIMVEDGEKLKANQITSTGTEIKFLKQNKN